MGSCVYCNAENAAKSVFCKSCVQTPRRAGLQSVQGQDGVDLPAIDGRRGVALSTCSELIWSEGLHALIGISSERLSSCLHFRLPRNQGAQGQRRGRLEKECNSNYCEPKAESN